MKLERKSEGSEQVSRAKEAVICLVLARGAQIEKYSQRTVLHPCLDPVSLLTHTTETEKLSMACKGTFQGTSGFCVPKVLLCCSAVLPADGQIASSYLGDSHVCRKRWVTKVSAALVSPLQKPWDLMIWQVELHMP